MPIGKHNGHLRGSAHPSWVGSRFEHYCLQCGKWYRRKDHPTAGLAKYCTRRCYWDSKVVSFSGPNNPRWKDGKSKGRREARHVKQYKRWRDAVYRRDKWHCQICNVHCQKNRRKKNQIVAHHIKIFSHFPDLRHETSNGITLCRGCHAKLHRQNRSVIDFTEILNHNPNRRSLTISPQGLQAGT